MKIKAILIDDDYFITEVLKDLLRENHPSIELLAVAHSGFDGLKVIEEHQPALIFLDVEMPDMNGFEMLSMLKEINFQVIFTTAYSQYAIKAIRFNALDYLVKPVDPKELRQAIRRFQKNLEQSSNQERVELALFNLQQEEVKDQILPLQLQDGEIRLRLSQIVRIEGERNYSVLRLADKSKKLSAKNLAYFEEILSDKDFFRCHKSYLINVLHIDCIQRDHFLLKDKQTLIPISRRRKKGAKEWFINRSQK